VLAINGQATASCLESNFMRLFTEVPDRTGWTGAGAALMDTAADSQARRAKRRWGVIGLRKTGSRAHRPPGERV